MESCSKKQISTMNKRKERSKIIRCFLILRPSELDKRIINIAAKYITSTNDKVNQNQDGTENIVIDSIDESSLTLFCLPNGIEYNESDKEPEFHSFLITKEDGSRVYGSTLIVWDRKDHNEYKYCNKALCFLTNIPFVVPTKKLLMYIWRNNCKPSVIESICDVQLPSRGKCLKLLLPKKMHCSFPVIHDSSNEQSDFEEIFIYRGLQNFPLFDYPLRQLFAEILSPDQFLSAFLAALLEFQILIISKSHYNLMLVAEALTSLLLPFSWQHVYVPILPSKLGLNFLDAPTPYIMGINSSHKEFSALSVNPPTSSVHCRIDCDLNKVDFFFDEELSEEDFILSFPPFIDELQAELNSIFSSDPRLSARATVRSQSEALKRVTAIAKKHKVIKYEFSYLDDLKLNQKIRIVFIKFIKQHILKDYEKFIVHSKKESATFDAVSYLCDQPDSIKSFLTKFLKTQMFVTFIDDSWKKISRNRQASSSILDVIDEIETNEKALDACFENSELIEFTEIININSSPIDCAFDSKLLASPIRNRQRSNAKLCQKEKDANCSNSSQCIQVSATANWKKVESLLNEVKSRTSSIVLSKMGKEERSRSGIGSLEDIEENTLIASLCDLIEKIWSHARTNDNENVRCSFWSHLVAFCTLQSEDEYMPSYDSNFLTPVLGKMSSESQCSYSTPPSPCKEPNSNEYLEPVSKTLYHDFKCIQYMSDLKTEVGKSRAFIRLALERKLLSDHLSVLLSNQKIVEDMYRRYAFLRCEERDLFLTHLLSLNIVDLHCFTNTFTTSILTYTLVFHGSGPLTGWISLTGSICRTSEISLSNVTNMLTFKHNNLGIVSTITISINPSSKVFIDMCFLRNEVTGHVYKFVCTRWFGKNTEDGATERVFIGDMIKNGCIRDIIKSSRQTRSSSIGRSWSKPLEKEQLEIQDLQQQLGKIVNDIVKFYYNNKEEITRQNNNQLIGKYIKSSQSLKHPRRKSNSSQKSLVSLIFGEKQLLWTLKAIFYYGFKNRERSSFRKQIFFWDYLTRVVSEVKVMMDKHRENAMVSFIKIVEAIEENAFNWGKDGKFELFLIISLRDQMLTDYLKYLSKPYLAQQYYEVNSFFRDHVLMTFLLQILATFNEIKLSIEPSLTKGL